MRRHQFFPSDGGFTLIELLCVMAIIALLVGMSFPAYSSFRDKSDGVKCTSNLRQIGASLQAYVGQNDGVFPQIEPDLSNPIVYDDPEVKGLQETLEPFGVTKEIVQCPADIRSQYKNYEKRKTSYEWRPLVDDELESAPQIFDLRRGSIRQFTISLSKFVICYDTDRVHGKVGDFKSNKNYLYADGHVRPYWDTAPRTKP